MTSDEFYRRFRNGELGDDMDLVEWSIFWDMHQATEKRLSWLGEAVAMTLAEHLASVLSDLAASSSVASFDMWSSGWPRMGVTFGFALG